mmetsp:Transcript_23438/g.70195  ORF Transcript_23438/g.70195 Transcript_23438/m.70195 type:complete len:212 (+) Transcript_23438:318-953(+)
MKDPRPHASRVLQGAPLPTTPDGPEGQQTHRLGSATSSPKASARAARPVPICTRCPRETLQPVYLPERTALAGTALQRIGKTTAEWAPLTRTLRRSGLCMLVGSQLVGTLTRRCKHSLANGVCSSACTSATVAALPSSNIAIALLPSSQRLQWPSKVCMVATYLTYAGPRPTRIQERSSEKRLLTRLHSSAWCSSRWMPIWRHRLRQRRPR